MIGIHNRHGFPEASRLEVHGGLIGVYNKRLDGMPDGAWYIGRGSRWGNPFVIGRHGNRDEVIARYAAWYETSGLDAFLDEIRGRSLVCWCAPARCHGHFLLARANFRCSDASQVYQSVDMIPIRTDHSGS